MAPPTLMIAATVVSAGATVAGGLMQYKSSRDAAKAAEDQADAQATLQRRDFRRRLGAIRAGIGASGLQYTGSPLSVMGDQAREAALRVQLTQWEGSQRAAAYRAEGNAALVGGLLGGASQGLSGYAGAKNMQDMRNYFEA